MQGSLKVPPNSNWRDIVEILSVLGSIGGSIASVVTQQVLFASIPLSLSVALNLVNRRQVFNEVKHHQSAIAQIAQEDVETQAELGTLTEQLLEVQQRTTTLSQSAHDLEDYTQNLGNEQTKIAEMVGYLQEIEACTQTIRINPNCGEAYYNRGLIYQSLGNTQGAIGDYTEAICINPSYAKAYYTRGIIRADIGDKKKAVADLREAAKHFFAEGDIASYQTARDFSKKFHALSSQPRTTTANEEKVPVECLFS